MEPEDELPEDDWSAALLEQGAEGGDTSLAEECHSTAVFSASAGTTAAWNVSPSPGRRDASRRSAEIAATRTPSA